MSQRVHNSEIITDKSFRESSVYKELKSRKLHTPDLRDLCKQLSPIYVVIYGKHETRAPLFPFFLGDKKSSPYLGRAISVNENFKMKRSFSPSASGEDFVVFSQKQSTTPIGYQDSTLMGIKGDLFAVDPTVMIKLDRLYKNNYKFVRNKHMFKLLDQEVSAMVDQKQRRPYLQAWLYVAEPYYWTVAKTALYNSLTEKINHKRVYTAYAF